MARVSPIRAEKTRESSNIYETVYVIGSIKWISVNEHVHLHKKTITCNIVQDNNIL